MGDTDVLQLFIDENLKFTQGSRLATRELHDRFNAFLADRGERPWTSRIFTARFGEHRGVQRTRVRNPEGPGVRYAWYGVAFQGAVS